MKTDGCFGSLVVADDIHVISFETRVFPSKNFLPICGLRFPSVDQSDLRSLVFVDPFKKEIRSYDFSIILDICNGIASASFK